MRHLYIYSIAAVLLCAACIKSETDGSNVISFVPVASKSTKAIIQDNTYPLDVPFMVSAYHNGTAAYFEGLQTRYITASNNLWETTTPEYWPLEGSLTFHSYSPAGVTGASISSSGVAFENYTVQNATQMTTDLLYASVTVDDCSAHPASVPLNFSHALSQIVFKVKADAYYENVAISMTSLSLSGIYSVGDFANEAWDNQESAQSYTLSSTSTALNYTANVPNVTDVCAYLFIPQTISADARLNVGYTIAQTVSGTTYTVANPPLAIPLRNTVTEWEPGKKYIYTISIGMDNLITFTATAADWTAQEGGVVVE